MALCLNSYSVKCKQVWCPLLSDWAHPKLPAWFSRLDLPVSESVKDSKALWCGVVGIDGSLGLWIFVMRTATPQLHRTVLGWAMDLFLGPLKFWNISLILISVTLTLATRPAALTVSLCWNGRFRSSSFSVAATSSSAPVWSRCHASVLHFHHLNFDRIKSLSQLVFESLVCPSSNSHCVLKINSALKTSLFKKIFFNWRIIALQCCISSCHTWMSHRYTYIPSLLSLPSHLIPLGWAPCVI